MGLLRFLLATSVILAHSQSFFGFTGMGGSAVPAFFIVSGFYMSFILANKYSGNDRLWLFYSNRFLRLYPMYWALLVVYVVLAQWTSADGWPFAQLVASAANPLRLATDGSAASWWAALPNLTFLGSDIIRVFLADASTGALQPWLRHLGESGELRGAYQYLLVPPIWSLGVEVVFYALAPFIARLRLRLLLVVLAGTFLLQFARYLVLRPTLAWYHLLSAYNLVYFILGMAAHRLAPHLLRHRRLSLALAVAPFALWASWQILPSFFFASGWIYWVVFAAGVPCLFEATKNSRLDSALGAYSYPMYLCHGLFTYPSTGLGPWAGVAATLASVGLSFLLIRLVDRPVEALRQSRAARLAPA